MGPFPAQVQEEEPQEEEGQDRGEEEAGTVPAGPDHEQARPPGACVVVWACVVVLGGGGSGDVATMREIDLKVWAAAALQPGHSHLLRRSRFCVNVGIRTIAISISVAWALHSPVALQPQLRRMSRCHGGGHVASRVHAHTRLVGALLAVVSARRLPFPL